MKSWLAALTIAAMLVSAFPVAAQGWVEARQTYAEAKENFLQAYSEWLKARADYVDARLAWMGTRSQADFQTMAEKARTAALKAADLYIAHMRMLEARANATRGLSEEARDNIVQELEGYISQIQTYRANIDSATIGTGALKSANRDLHQYWLSIRVRLKQITAELIVAGFRGIVERAQALASRVEVVIQQLKENGVDTSDLEAWLDDFSSHIELAEQKLDNAEAKIPQISDNLTFRQIYASAIQHLRDALQYLCSAFKDLKDIVVSLRSQGCTVVLAGSGTVVAQGSGTVQVEGTGLLKVTTIENGELTVSPNAHVKTDGVAENLDNGDIQYTGFTWVRVTGSNIRASLSGTNMWLRASGTGTVVLSGTGTYWTYGENEYHSSSWTEEGATVELATGSVQGVS